MPLIGLISRLGSLEKAMITNAPPHDDFSIPLPSLVTYDDRLDYPTDDGDFRPGDQAFFLISWCWSIRFW